MKQSENCQQIVKADSIEHDFHRVNWAEAQAAKRTEFRRRQGMILQGFVTKRSKSQLPATGVA
jgi:hypothetical protein